MNIRHILLALVVVIIWGVNFSIIKIGLQELPPILFSALRFAVVALPAVFLVPFPRTSIWNVVTVGLLLGVIKFSLLFVAMKNDAGAGLASLILQAQVLFTVALSVYFLGEKIARYQVVGILIAIAGFSLFFLDTRGNITYVGLVLILLAALAWALSNLVMKRTHGVNLVHFMVWVSLIPPLPLLILSFITETDSPIRLLLATTPSTWLSLAFVSYVSTLAAFAIWGWLLRRYPAITITPFALLVPVVGLSTSAMVLGERLQPLEAAGTGLVLAGLVVCVLGNRLLKVIRFNQPQSLITTQE